MAQTKQEIRNAWNKAHYKSYTVVIRYDREQDMIDYIEKKKENGEFTSDIIKECISFMIEKGEESNPQLDAIAKKQGKTTKMFIRDALYHYMDDLGIERINLE